MEYVHTVTKVKFDKYEISLYNQHVQNYLVSLIDGLKQSSFGLNTLVKTANDIEYTRKLFNPDKKWFIDSGGYSIIVGDVHPRDITKFIDCYNYYLEKFAPTNCDYMLSLDIPIFLKYPTYNTIKYVKQKNHQSLSKSKAILDADDQLYDKFIFIWQFKTPNQYKIWKDLYQEIFENEDRLYHFAIGGMVGLKGITSISFAPFTGPCFKIIDIIKKKNLNKTSILHLLGVNSISDRFHIAFLDKLFNKYLEDSQSSVKITYDTINHLVSGFYKIRDLYSIIKENNKYIHKNTHLLIDKMNLLIEDHDTLIEVQKNLQDIVNGNQISNTYVVATMEVVKNQIINTILEDVILKYDLVNVFLSNNFNRFRNIYNSIHQQLRVDYPFIFKNKRKQIILNFQYLYAFHDWFINGRDPVKLEILMDKFIKLIGFPVDLT